MRTDPDRAYEALAHIKDNSRAALDELRDHRRSAAPARRRARLPRPHPGLADLDALVGSVRAGGSVRDGEPARHTAGPWRPPSELTAYRIIQEALTNTHKHASATRAEVVLDYGATDRCAITVTDDGRPDAARGPGTGHGLIGMRERATAVGGTVTAGPRPEGGFQVVAELPLSLAPASA